MLYRESSLKLDFVCNRLYLLRAQVITLLLPPKSALNNLAHERPTEVLLRLRLLKTIVV